MYDNNWDEENRLDPRDFAATHGEDVWWEDEDEVLECGLEDPEVCEVCQ